VEEEVAQQILSSYTTAKDIVLAETAEASSRKGIKSIYITQFRVRSKV
jgi:hypothetical protein